MKHCLISRQIILSTKYTKTTKKILGPLLSPSFVAILPKSFWVYPFLSFVAFVHFVHFVDSFFGGSCNRPISWPAGRASK